MDSSREISTNCQHIGLSKPMEGICLFTEIDEQGNMVTKTNDGRLVMKSING